MFILSFQGSNIEINQPCNIVFNGLKIEVTYLTEEIRVETDSLDAFADKLVQSFEGNELEFKPKKREHQPKPDSLASKIRQFLVSEMTYSPLSSQVVWKMVLQEFFLISSSCKSSLRSNLNIQLSSLVYKKILSCEVVDGVKYYTKMKQ